MLKQIIIATSFAASTLLAQPFHLPDYFPLNQNGKWIYEDEYGNSDTAAMQLNVPFALDTVTVFSFGPNEKQYFKADDRGLGMMGITIPMGTFAFTPPLRFAQYSAQVGDQVNTFNWNLIHIPSLKSFNWGFSHAQLIDFSEKEYILGLIYDSVITIHVRCGNGNGMYYLAKGIGIVRAEMQGSPTFQRRELKKYIAGSSAVAKAWKSSGDKKQLGIFHNGKQILQHSIFPSKSDKSIQVDVFSLTGKKMESQTLKVTATMALYLKSNLKGAHILVTKYSGQTMKQRVVF